MNNTSSTEKNTNSTNSNPKIRTSTFILSIILTAIVVLVVVLAVLYFTTLNEVKSLKEVSATQATEVTLQTEPEAENVTETEAETTTSAKETTAPSPAFNSYTITIRDKTYVYSGPGHEYHYVMTIYEQGVYTIVDERIHPSTGEVWGKLKSGAGWVNITAVKSYHYYEVDHFESSYEGVEPYLYTVSANTNVYEGPGFSYDVTMTITDKGVYTIVDQHLDGSGMCVWGKLKSGAGWIPVEYLY